MRSIVRIGLVSAVMALSSVAGYSNAASAAELKSVAVVDVERIFAKASAVKVMRGFYAKKKKEYQQMVAQFEADLAEKRKDLVGRQGDLTEQEFAKERNKIEKDVLAARKRLQGLDKQANGSLAQADKKVRSEALKIIEKISKERGFDMVFYKDALIVFDVKKFDITDEALKRLDKALPKVDLKKK